MAVTSEHRILPDDADLDELTPPPPTLELKIQPIDDAPPDQSSADADDEEPGGYHGGRR